MMPVLLDVQKRLIRNKSPADNKRDIERCLAAADNAAAEHNRVLKEHFPQAGKELFAKPIVREPATMPGIMLVQLNLQSQFITAKSPDENAYDMAGILQAATHALGEHNLVLLEHWPQIPDLYEAGVRYKTDPNAWMVQTLKSIPTIKQQGGSDCKNLVGWRLAHKWRDELKRLGKKLSRCKIYWRFLKPDQMLRSLPVSVLDRMMPAWREVDAQTLLSAIAQLPPGRLFHAEMRTPDSPYGYTTPDGDVEDMSRYLGM